MIERKNIFAIVGSAGKNSANEKLINIFRRHTVTVFDVVIFNELRTLPHFDPELSIENPTPSVRLFRNSILESDAVLICTPEYIFSIPSGLKNALEWCVSTTAFSDKPCGLITASASGQKGHEELQLIMKTLMAKFNEKTTLLIRGVKGKFNEHDEIKDQKTENELLDFINAFKELLKV